MKGVKRPIIGVGRPLKGVKRPIIGVGRPLKGVKRPIELEDLWKGLKDYYYLKICRDTEGSIWQATIKANHPIDSDLNFMVDIK